LIRPILPGCILLMALAACSQGDAYVPRQGATTPASSDAVGDAAHSMDASENADLRLWSRIGGLPSQTVEADSCGLFLWASMPKRTLVFFADNLSGNAKLMYNGQQRSLPRLMARGDVLLGHFSEQTFEDETLRVSVSYRAEVKEGLRGGAIIREGTWRIAEKTGWELIIPVAGLIGCN